MKPITTTMAFTAHADKVEEFKKLIRKETDFNFSEALRFLMDKALKNPDLLK